MSVPKKTPEQLREQVVELRKKNVSYTRIEKAMVEQGTPLSRPTLIKILREAGLTKSASAASSSASTSSPPTQTRESRSLPAPATSNGVDEFMPKAPAKKVEPKEYECDNCGAEFTADDPADLPEACPRCGA